MSDATRFGFVALLGAPNTGKSTLLNRVVGAKVSIVTPKAQTTRSRVLGIRMAGKTQIVFVDTPGIFQPRRRLDRAMVSAAWSGASDADLVMLLVDAHRGVDAETRAIATRLADSKRPVVLVLNKIDAAPKTKLLTLAADMNAAATYVSTFMISATTGDGVTDLIEFIAAQLPEGHWHFPEDQLSDVNERLFAAEITREKLFFELSQELPYAAFVETEAWEERKDGSVRIAQVIVVEKDSQKKIVVGKGGARVKAIGAAARRDLEQLLERRVHLFLFVKVRAGWGEDPDSYRAFGLDFKS